MSPAPPTPPPPSDAPQRADRPGTRTHRPTPVLLLAGRDRGTTHLPEKGKDHHLLKGYKSLELKVDGKPLIAELAGRLLATGGFGPVWIAGPAHLYQPLIDDGPLAGAHLVDTDSDFGRNLEAGVETTVAAHPGQPLAVLTSDILPEARDLELALEDYRQASPCDFWMCEIRIPPDLGKLGHSAWKPKYHLRPKGESQGIPTLPGHLVIVDPEVIRLHLVYKIFDLAYRTRNRAIGNRRWAIVRGALAVLFSEDWQRLLRGRPPTVMLQMLYHGLALGAKLRTGAVAQEELEERLRIIWVDDRHRARHRERRGRVAILDALTLARDIDTVEEAREILGSGAESPPGSG